MSISEVVYEIVKIAKKYPEYLIGSLAPFFTLFVAILNYKYHTKSFRYIFIFVIFFILSDLPLWITTALKLNNIFFGNLRDLMIPLVLSLIYFIGLKKKTIIYTLSSFIAIMVTLIFLKITGIVNQGQIKWIFVFLLGCNAIWYFVMLLENPIIKDILVYPFFWFNTGILFFCFSSLMINFFFNFTLTPDIKTPTYYIFHSIIEYISATMFLFFGLGFWFLKNNQEIRKS